ncbi:MAG TPA: hypothetical protein VGJ74_05610 [Burkholderiales bacterium]
MRPLWIVLAAALAGCSTLMLDPPAGHTRLEVESIMGNARAGGGWPELVFGRVQYLQARNPMREPSSASACRGTAPASRP